jgi:hypothetical protein
LKLLCLLRSNGELIRNLFLSKEKKNEAKKSRKYLLKQLIFLLKGSDLLLHLWKPLLKKYKSFD